MSTKYILDPSGDIIKVVPSFKILEGNERLGIPELRTQEKLVTQTFEEKPNVDKTDYLENVNEGQNANVNLDAISITGLGVASFQTDSGVDTKYVVGSSKNDPSFNFVSDPSGTSSQNSYKPFSSFTNLGDEDKPKSFADEFEILTGMRFRLDELADSGEVLGLFFTYLVESLVRIITVEAVVTINQTLTSKNRNETYENYTLRLGKYDLDEYDVFTKYVFNVLNYPHDKSTVDERVAAYFLGFSSWIAPDMVFDINKFAEDKFSINNTIGLYSNLVNTSGVFDFLGGREGTTIITSTVIALTEAVASAFTNTTLLNRLKLLLRKFYQEKYWDSNILYRAKSRNDVLSFFADLNYYYFRFYIERVQIGLKLLDRYYDNITYMDNKDSESPMTRVSANRTTNKVSDIKMSLIMGPGLESISDISYFDSNGNENYSWNYRNSDENPINGGQTTRIRALPQALNMNNSFYKSLALNNKARLDISPSILQNFYTSDDRRLPQDLVVEIENHLESEYMPFYFHDLRTNEILSFHAFIENISDSFTPDYNAASGFGRIDDVRSYVKTTRSISLTFMLAATSEIDHDLMWYQINKIVSMCYPQWSDAFSVETKDAEGNILAGKFKYPFTQVPTASPLIRLRVGDVIKSNYSRGNLSRLHGIGDREGLDKDFGAFKKDQLSEAQRKVDENKEQAISNQKAKGEKDKNDKIAEIERKFGLDTQARQATLAAQLKDLDDQLRKRINKNKKIISERRNINTFKKSDEEMYGQMFDVENEKGMTNKQKDMYMKSYVSWKGAVDQQVKKSTKIIRRQKSIIRSDIKSKKDALKNAKATGDSKASRVKKAELKKVGEQSTSATSETLGNITKNSASNKEKINKVFATDPVCYLLPGIYKTNDYKSRAINITKQMQIDTLEYSNLNDILLIKIKIEEKMIEIFVDPSRVITQEGIYFVNTGVDKALADANEILSPTKKVGEAGNSVTVSNNPITRAYESGMSRGLAGFITNLDVSYNESTWETTRIGSKAPIMVKLAVSFTPIHDIPPGLDHNGMMRAPVYNVGRLNNEFFGDPHDGYGTYNKNTGKLDKENYYQGAGRDAAMQKYNQILNANKKK